MANFSLKLTVAYLAFTKKPLLFILFILLVTLLFLI